MTESFLAWLRANDIDWFTENQLEPVHGGKYPWDTELRGFRETGPPEVTISKNGSVIRGALYDGVLMYQDNDLQFVVFHCDSEKHRAKLLAQLVGE